MVRIPVGRRAVFIVSAPDLVRRVFVDAREQYPKSDLMRTALGPLVGEGILVSDGETWQHDRAMLEPAFAHMRLEAMFPQMQAAVVEHSERLRALGNGALIDLEQELSHVTSDIIFRVIFSQPIDGAAAAEVFGAFMRYQRGAPQFDLPVILRSDPDHPEPPDATVADDARAVRRLIGRLLDERLAAGQRFVDFAQAAIDARDSAGQPFSRDQLIDQLTVLFLAGHETSASALTWTVFMLSQQPHVLQSVREELSAVLGERPMAFADARALGMTRNVFREALRLYPPAAFLTRRAAAADRLDGIAVPRGALLVVSPWVVHRHQALWAQPGRFLPERFDDSAVSIRPGTYIPFGLGPRVCTGAAIAQLEGQLILAEHLRCFDFEPVAPERVRPVSRVTIRPAGGMRCRVWLRAGSSAG